MCQVNESNLDQLYHSTITAFPFTTKRQHATDTIKIVKIDWTPFVGMKTLFVKGLVENEGKMYDTYLLFKDVDYKNEKNEQIIPIMASDGITYSFVKLDETKHDILVRCSCPDFRYRFAYYNKQSESLWGKTPPKYKSKGLRSPANPLKLEGMCKHIMKTVKSLSAAGLFADNLSQS